MLALCALALVAFLFVRAALAARLERADLIINNGTEVSSLDPASVTGVPEGRVMRAIFEGLVSKHPRTLEPVPGMAETWEVSEDGLDYTFHLRPTNRWSNGDAFTAHDFVFSWERLLRPETAAEYAYQAWSIRGAEAYTRADPGLFFAGDAAPSTLFVEELDNGNVRLGPSLFAFGTDEQLPLELAVGVGATVQAGDALWTAHDGTRARAPFGGVVAAIEARDAVLGVMPANDVRAGWRVELQVGATARQGALDAQRLFTEPDWRATAFSFVGVSTSDDYTLHVRLHSPTPYFIDLTGFYPLFPVHRPSLEFAQSEWPETWQVEWLRPDRLVTNGPYYVTDRRINDRIRLTKNERYWDADHVAINTIDILAVESYVTMMNLFLTGEVDWIDRMTPNLVPRLIKREDFRPEPYLGTYFYRVNVTRAPFDNVLVRKALALAIPRVAITDKILKAGQLPNWSLMPHGIPGYDKPELEHAPRGEGIDEATAFAADCERARGLLTEAGYPGGEGLRAIEINYNTSEAHRDIAEVIGATWQKELGIGVKLANQEWKVYLDSQRTLDYDLSRSAWIGDYADPNTFSDLWVTGGENNRTSWGDPRYDASIRAAASEPDEAKRMQHLMDAERVLMEELPILPIYTYVTQNMVNPRLGGFYENLQDEHFPKWFYWRDDAELKELRAQLPKHLSVVPAVGPANGQYPPAGRGAVTR